MPILNTTRTVIRPFVSQDALVAFSWFGNEQVMKFSPHGPDGTVKDTIVRIAQYQQHQKDHGFAKWLILDRSSLSPIGDCGPMYCQEYHCFELGYRLLPEYWQRGLATEVAEAWLNYCFQTLRLDRLMAFAHPDNLASIRVLNKIGFVFFSRNHVMNMEAMLFNIENHEYRF